MNGHKILTTFSLVCLFFGMAIAVNGLLNYKPSTSTFDELFMLIFLFVGLLGVFTGMALREQNRRIKNIEKRVNEKI